MKKKKPMIFKGTFMERIINKTKKKERKMRENMNILDEDEDDGGKNPESEPVKMEEDLKNEDSKEMTQGKRYNIFNLKTLDIPSFAEIDENKIEALDVEDLLTKDDLFSYNYNNETFKSREKTIQEDKKRRRNLGLIKKINLTVDKKNTGALQKTFYSILKEKKNNPKIKLDDAIKNVLGYNYSMDQVNFFMSIMNLKAGPLQRISLPQKLCKEDINLYVCTKSKKKTTLTNDWLSLYYDSLEVFNSKSKINDLVSNINYNLSSVKIVSLNAFKLPNSPINYYCQDYHEDYYLNEFAYLDQQDKEEFIKKVTESNYVDTMKLEGREYCVDISEGVEVIYPKTRIVNGEVKEVDYDYIKELSLNTEFLYTNKGELVKGTKSVNGLNSYFFYSQTLTPVRFCPSTLKFNTNSLVKEEIEFIELFKYKLDLNYYMNYCIEKKKFIMIPNVLIWENMNGFFEFLKVISILDIKNNLTDFGKLINVLDFYENDRNYFAQWKAHYDNFKKIVYGFLDCFGSKINLDKLFMLTSACNDFIADRRYLSSLEKFKIMVKYLLVFSEGSVLMVNFLKENVLNVVRGISYASELMKYPSEIEKEEFNIDLNIRSIGLMIYNIFLNGDMPVIPDIRCEANFLGGVMGSFPARQLFENINELVQIQKEKEKEKYKKRKVNNDLKNKIIDLTFERLKKYLENSTKFNKYSSQMYNTILQGYQRKEPKIYGLLTQIIDDTEKMYNTDADEEKIINAGFSEDGEIFNGLGNFMDIVSSVENINMGLMKINKDERENVAGKIQIKPEDIYAKMQDTSMIVEEDIASGDIAKSVAADFKTNDERKKAKGGKKIIFRTTVPSKEKEKKGEKTRSRGIKKQKILVKKIEEESSEEDMKVDKDGMYVDDDGVKREYMDKLDLEAFTYPQYNLSMFKGPGLEGLTENEKVFMQNTEITQDDLQKLKEKYNNDIVFVWPNDIFNRKDKMINKDKFIRFKSFGKDFFPDDILLLELAVSDEALLNSPKKFKYHAVPAFWVGNYIDSKLKLSDSNAADMKIPKHNIKKDDKDFIVNFLKEIYGPEKARVFYGNNKDGSVKINKKDDVINLVKVEELPLTEAKEKSKKTRLENLYKYEYIY